MGFILIILFVSAMFLLGCSFMYDKQNKTLKAIVCGILSFTYFALPFVLENVFKVNL